MQGYLCAHITRSSTLTHASRRLQKRAIAAPRRPLREGEGIKPSPPARSQYCLYGRVATRLYEPESSLRRGASRRARLCTPTICAHVSLLSLAHRVLLFSAIGEKSARRFSRASLAWQDPRSAKPLLAQALRFTLLPRRFPNDRSGFCQICSWLNCSALCTNSLRAKLIPWKHQAQKSVRPPRHEDTKK